MPPGSCSSLPLARADTVVVANLGVNTITKYDDSGTGSPFTNAFVNGPNGLALDSSGNLYVSTNANSIEKFAPDGTDLGVFASTGLNFAMALAFDSSGNLYAANFGGNTHRRICARTEPTSASSPSSLARPGLPSMARAIFTWQILEPRFCALRPMELRSEPSPPRA